MTHRFIDRHCLGHYIIGVWPVYGVELRYA